MDLALRIELNTSRKKFLVRIDSALFKKDAMDVGAHDDGEIPAIFVG